MIQALLIEDCEADVRLLLVMLKEHCQFTHIKYIPASESDKVQNSYDIILTDLGLPASQGTDTVEKVRELFPETPIVVLTGTEDEEMHTRCLRAGACSVHPKSAFSEESLLLSMHCALERHAEEVVVHQRTSISKALRLMRSVKLGLDALQERATL
jgi:DNA-binding NarL/FixJ family response regulator